MDNDILSRMEAEEADLAQKLDAVRQFLAVYRGKPAKASARAPATGPRPFRSLEDRLDKFGPYGHRIVDAVASILPGNSGNPVRTKLLVEQLAALDVEITGANKVNSLSALLARSSKIKGYGRAGWTRQDTAAGDRYPFKANKTFNEAVAEAAETDATRASPSRPAAFDSDLDDDVPF